VVICCRGRPHHFVSPNGRDFFLSLLSSKHFNDNKKRLYSLLEEEVRSLHSTTKKRIVSVLCAETSFNSQLE